jgi:hypothetical protein
MTVEKNKAISRHWFEEMWSTPNPDMAAMEDRGWMRYQGAASQDGPTRGFTPTGKQVAFDGAAILYIDPGGKIVDRWDAFCFCDILTDLGPVPPSRGLQEKLS